MIPDLFFDEKINFSIKASGYEFLELEDVLPDDDFLIKLTELAALSGRIQAEDSEFFTSGFIQIPGYDVEESVFDAGELQGLQRIDETGRFCFDVPAGQYAVWFYVPGYIPVMRDISVKPGENPRLNIQIKRGGSISGYVIDAETEEPIADAGIRMKVLDSNLFFKEFTSIHSQEDGFFKREGIPEGPLYLSVCSYYGHVDKILKDVSIYNEKETHLTIKLKSNGNLSGTVKRGNKKEEGVYLELIDHNQTFTNSDGEYDFPDVSPGKYLLFLSFEDGENNKLSTYRNVYIAPGKKTVVNFDIDEIRGVQLSGKITYKGKPWNAELIEIIHKESGKYSETVFADSSGMYSIILPGSGSYEIYIEGEFGEIIYSINLEIPSGINKYTVNIELPDCEIRGEILNYEEIVDYFPIRVYSVLSKTRHGSLKDLSQGITSRGYLDDKGKFVFPYLNPGVYSVLIGGNINISICR